MDHAPHGGGGTIVLYCCFPLRSCQESSSVIPLLNILLGGGEAGRGPYRLRLRRRGISRARGGGGYYPLYMLASVDHSMSGAAEKRKTRDDTQLSILLIPASTFCPAPYRHNATHVREFLDFFSETPPPPPRCVLLFSSSLQLLSVGTY